MTLVVLALAFTLRAFQVDQYALRGDEAFSVSFAQLPWAEMLRLWQTSEPHPPLHFALLRGWMPLAGTSDLAVRWPSVLAGTLMVALAVRLGRHWLGQRGALWAGLLVAVHPFLIWHAQDARMNTFVPIASLGAIMLTWLAAHRGGWWRWLAAGALWVVALFTHYFAGLALASLGLGLVLAPGTRRAWRPALGMALGVALAFAPWLALMLNGLADQARNWESRDVLMRLWATYSVGGPETGTPATWLLWGGSVWLALAAWGLWHLARTRRDVALWLGVMLVGVPVLCLAITAPRNAFAERYLITAVPLAQLLAAAGLAHLTRARNRAAGLAAGLAVLASLVPLTHHYFDATYRKSPDWHGLAQHLEQVTSARDLAVMNLPDPTLYLYAHNRFALQTLPAQPGDTPTHMTAQVRAWYADFDRVFFLAQPSPLYDAAGNAGATLAACCALLADQTVAGFRVQTWELPPASLAASTPFNVQFDDGLTLVGYRVLTTTLSPGQAWPLMLVWHGAERASHDYTVFAHLLAADGFYLAGADGLPRTPTRAWNAAPVLETRPFLIPPDLPAGSYRLVVGLYHADTGQRLLATLPDGTRAEAVPLPLRLTVAPTSP